jgi:hypothetical protein
MADDKIAEIQRLFYKQESEVLQLYYRPTREQMAI